MENLLKAKIQRGRQVIGTMFQLGCPTAVECLGVSGLDFFIIDTEHAPISIENTRMFVMASELHKITPLVRIKRIARDIILNALDVGAGGIIAPGIETPDEVREMVRFAKYPQDGSRGFCYTRTTSFGYDPVAQNPEEYFRYSNQETLVIPQCETRSCVEHIEEIVSIPGVDGIFVGPFDLSTSLGKPADFENPEYHLALERVLSACAKANKFAFILSTVIDKARGLFGQGFSGIVFNSDIDILIRSYQDIVRGLRGGGGVTQAPKERPDSSSGDHFSVYLKTIR